MSNASPLKEPSMDEILASIRRIIESGDERPTPVVRPRAVSDSSRVRSMAMQAESASGSRAGSGEFARMPMTDHGAATVSDDASGAEVRPVAEDEPAGAAKGGPDWSAPLASLADLSANDRPLPAARRGFPDRALPRAAEARAEALAQAPLDPRGEAVAGPLPAATPPASAAMSLEGLRPATSEYPARIEQNVLPAEPAPQPAPYDFNLEFDEESFSSELRDEVVSVFSQVESRTGEPVEEASGWSFGGAPFDDDVPAPPSLIAETSSLMSEAAGAQVASAFDELARAIREGQMKSMEEMARHMLRPMLQEWLDDNLPRIVERLVREEIERVARGGRR
jgi:cell pole-organizing protein PopZ